MARASKTTATPSTTKTDSSPAVTEPTATMAPPSSPQPTAEVDVAAPTDSASSVFDQFNVFMSKLQTIATQMSTLRTEFRNIERQVVRELKSAAKMSSKRKRKSGNRAPSGFVKPTLISNELASFLGKPVGTEMARTEVTREINAYIREHKLQDKENGRKIIADKKLTGLLKLKKGDELTYFNLQKYMSPHFAKASDKAAATAAA